MVLSPFDREESTVKEFFEKTQKITNQFFQSDCGKLVLEAFYSIESYKLPSEHFVKYVRNHITQIQELQGLCYLFLRYVIQVNALGPSVSCPSLADEQLEKNKLDAKQLFEEANQHVDIELEWEPIKRFWKTFPLGCPDDRIGESSSDVVTNEILSKLRLDLEIDGNVLSDASKGIGMLWACNYICGGMLLALNDSEDKNKEISCSLNVITTSQTLHILQSRIAYIWQCLLKSENAILSHTLASIYAVHTYHFIKHILSQKTETKDILNKFKQVELKSVFVSDNFKKLKHEEFQYIEEIELVDYSNYTNFLLEYVSRLNALKDPAANEVIDIISFIQGVEITQDSVMGTRRMHQTEAIPQLVVNVKSFRDQSNTNETKATEQNDESIFNMLVSLNEVDPDAEIFEVVKTLDTHSDQNEQILSLPVVLILLQKCYATLNSSSHDDVLTKYECRAYIERCIQNAKYIFARKQYWAVGVMCLYMRSLTEFNRSQTYWRSIFQLQKLLDVFKFPVAELNSRTHCFHLIPYPFRTEIASAAARHHRRAGSLLSACEIYIELWMWEEAIECLIGASRKSQALSLVKQQLQKDPNNPRLLVCMGDLTDKRYYEKAWEVSKNGYALAQQRLGEYYQREQKIDEAVKHYALALELNPYHPNLWFTQGCCQLQLGMYDKALNSFSQVVISSDENLGPAWANMAAIHHHKKANANAMSCIKNAVKHSHQNANMWESYVSISIEANCPHNTRLGIIRLLELNQQNKVQDWMLAMAVTPSISQCKAKRLNAIETENELQPVVEFLHTISQYYFANRLVIYDCYAALAQALNNIDMEYSNRIKHFTLLIKKLTDILTSKCETKRDHILKLLIDFLDDFSQSFNRYVTQYPENRTGAHSKELSLAFSNLKRLIVQYEVNSNDLNNRIGKLYQKLNDHNQHLDT